MCSTCGCGVPAHEHGHGHEARHARDHGAGQTPDLRRIAVEEALFAKNDRLAAATRVRLERRDVLTLNLVSSPGAGKTSLLVRTLTDLRGQFLMAVIEGDQVTDLDTQRIAATGAPAVQINTGAGCHLDAEMVTRACERLDLPTDGVLFIENVGNLVCPAAFDLGETAKVVLVSITEGDDKPLKYPDMFAAASLMVLTKTDLSAHVPAEPDRLVANAKRVNPAIETMALSALGGSGLGDWYHWIEARRRHSYAAHDARSVAHA